ncbi:PREDICTED: low-temperature-induced 65 kDa protein-like [Camelina sativa]|uniref:Low-temperature-induced 65 kDa protein-like n=1 Tax=Camelina sativa TaxID=90675 RepID=A0ABM0UL46_CAMSA|nr:PREDICTED: low-temperature-induced 65 kDa protein-like [Camelina sativa]
MESQMTRPYGHDQAEDPIRIHHPEEEEHHEKGASKVLKKVKEKAKKIKNSLTKHGNGHDHDVDEAEYDEYEEQDPEVHGAPVYESSAVRGGVTGKPESLSHTGETNVPATDEIVPPGTKVFPVVSSEQTKPIEPVSFQDTAYGHEALTDPVRPMDTSDWEERREAPTHYPLGVSDREESRESHYESLDTPVSLLSATEDVTRTFSPGGDDDYLGGQRKVNIETPKRLEEDPAGPGGGSDYLSGVSNYQSKVTDPTKEGGVAGIPEIAESLGRMKVTDESPGQTTGQRDLRSQEFGLKNESGIGKDSPARFGGESGGLEESFPTRSDDVKVGLGRDLPTGTHDQFSPELSRPKERGDSEETREEATHETKPSTYTEQFASATSAITNKAIAAKNALASKLGYSGESGGGVQYDSTVKDETPRSATGYGQTVAGTVAEKLTPVYEKVKETGSTVMTKLPLSGGGSGVKETQQGEEKGVTSARDYLSEKLKPGEEDKALSEVIAEKLHFGGGGEKKKTTATKEVEVTVEKIPIPTEKILEDKEHREAVAEEGKGGGGVGMVGKVKGAVTSWLGGTKEEVKPKSPHSVEESPQSLGTTVGTMGFSDSSGSDLGGVGGARGVQPSSGN